MLEKRIVEVDGGRKYIEVKGMALAGELSEVKLPKDKIMLVGIGEDNAIHPAYVYYPMFGEYAWTMDEVNQNDANFEKVVAECKACDTMGSAWRATDAKSQEPSYAIGKSARPSQDAPAQAQASAQPAATQVTAQTLSLGKIPMPYVVAGMEIVQNLVCKKKSGKFLSDLLLSGLFDYISTWPQDKGMQDNLRELSSLYAGKMKICAEDVPAFEQEMRDAYNTYQETNDLLEGVRRGMFGKPATTKTATAAGKTAGKNVIDLTKPVFTRRARVY